MDAGKKREISEAEAKSLLTAIAAANISAFLLQFPYGDTKKAKWHLHTKWVALQDRIPEFREPECFILGWAFLIAQEGDTISIF